MPSLASWLAQGTLVSTFAATATFIVYTKHCHFTPVSAATDPVVQSRFYKRFNPRSHPAVHDLCVRKIPLFKLKRELVEDAEKGGAKLVERFAGGCWGNFGMALQRKILEQMFRKDPTTNNQLWDRQAILDSSYEEGTEALNHFQVLQKTPTTILFRAGDRPSVSPNGPRGLDALLEVTATADLDRGFAEFRFRTLLFDGESERPQEGSEVIAFAHRMYTKLIVETGVKNCMN